jgi:hypothetical protein
MHRKANANVEACFGPARSRLAAVAAAFSGGPL